MQSQQISELSKEDCILTVNRRLSRSLSVKIGETQRARGHLAWQSNKILPLNAWLYSQSHQYLLPDTYAEILWHKIINESELGTLFICQEQAAKQAFAAWKLMHEFEIPFESLDNSEYEVVQVWLEWADRYRNIIEKNHWLDSATYFNHITLTKPSGKIYCVGFDRLTPRHEKLITQLNAIVLTEQHDLGEKKLVCAQDIDQEIHRMIAWAAANRDKKIACVVPNINQHYQKLIAGFAEQKCEANIIAAVSLSTYPIVSAALLLLKICSDVADFSEVSSVLRSPFFVAQFEKDFRLREHATPSLSFSDLENIPQAKESTQSAREWAHYFKELLSHFRWPGQRILHTEEVQAENRFLELLKELAATEILDQSITQTEALSRLSYLAEKTYFQPQSADTNIQVMGLLETAGLTFDAIWLMEMTDETLPEPLSPNPFIPMDIQKKYDLPRANSNTELLYAQKIIDRLARSTPELIISYARTDGDRHILPSPLFSDLIAEEFTPIPSQDTSCDLQSLLDERAPAISSEKSIRGGSYILKAQAACPFKAFGEIRLNAHPLPEPVAGLQAFERGNIVHAILESIWTEIKTHSQLLSLSNDKIDFHIDNFFLSQPTSPMLNIEKLRVRTVLKKWLEYEKQRPPFTVYAVEQQQQFTLAGLSLSIRIDRIDQLADNSLAIIDYKTGNTNISDWFGERPLEPQLPLYCLANDNVMTISFAKIRLKECCFDGVSAIDNLLPDTKPAVKFATSWSNLKNQWQENLTQLAKQFLAGDAKVDPKNGANTCEFCHCQPLCRIQ